MTVRPAKTQISLGIRSVRLESSLCAQWVAKEPSFLHADSEDSDQTGWMPRLIWVFAGRTCHIVSFVMRWLILCERTAKPQVFVSWDESVWPIFHGWVISLNILKTIWWIDVKCLDNESVWCNLWPQNKCRSQWPIFHASVILSYILKTIWYMKFILEILDQ